MDREKERALVQLIDELNNDRRARGKELVPLEVDELFPFPADDFDDLITGLQLNNFTLFRTVGLRDPVVLSTVGTIGDNFWSWVGIIVTYLSPILAIALGFLVSWWCLLLVVGFFFGMRITAGAYDRALFRAALSSEPAFCFLYSLKTITLRDNRDGDIYFQKYG